MGYYIQEMVPGDFDKYFSIKRYLGGTALGKCFTAKLIFPIYENSVFYLIRIFFVFFVSIFCYGLYNICGILNYLKFS